MDAAPPAPAKAEGTIALSLVSHTNAGKTTLARTLLGRDVGTVRDAPHVTESATVYTMIDTGDGAALQLWDTPGFGDSVRLARRLEQAASPLGWFMGSVWDRFRDRPLWSSQQAARNARDHADVVLYLVNASEHPAEAAYVEPEMRILAYIGKPVIALLNQMGPPRAAPAEDTEVQRWRRHLSAFAFVSDVLPLDAFARCWVQEFRLLAAVEAALPPPQRPTMARLGAAWQARRIATFGAALESIAASVARTAADRQIVADSGLRDRLREVGVALGVARETEGPRAQAMRQLAERLDAEVRANTADLIALHALEGEAQGVIITRLAEHYDVRARLDEGKAALVGGAVTGALAGLKADLATGGLTFGAGLLAGGLIGALGAAGLARGVNLVRGTEHTRIAWNDDVLDRLVEAALLRYLAVAHYGRGRGQWREAEAPAHWRGAVGAALATQRPALAAAWQQREDPAALTALLVPAIGAATRATLQQLYPGALADAGGDVRAAAAAALKNAVPPA
jgi:hypothetical protein